MRSIEHEQIEEWTRVKDGKGGMKCGEQYDIGGECSGRIERRAQEEMMKH